MNHTVKVIVIASLCIFFAQELVCSSQKKIISIISSFSDNNFSEDFLKNIVEQTIFTQAEVILFNAGVTDESILTRYKKEYPNIIILKQNQQEKPLPTYEQLNICLYNASGEYITYMHPETRHNKTYVEDQITFLENNPSIDATYSNYYSNQQRENEYQLIEPQEFSYSLLNNHHMWHNLVWRLSMNKKYGFFNKNFDFFGTWEMLNRAVCYGALFKKNHIISGIYRQYDMKKTPEREREYQYIVNNYSLMWQQQQSPQEMAVDEKPMVFVILSYNNKDWFEQNLSSVTIQQYHNYRIIYIDDASTDGTGDLVSEFIKKNNLEDRCTLIRNSTRKGVSANWYKAINLCKPHEIVINLDGDDWLAHEYVLYYLNRIYHNERVWLTYGQFIEFPLYKIGWAVELPEIIVNSKLYRCADWVTCHLRSHYAWLAQKIKKQDLQHNGSWIMVASDVAEMCPMLEMAGHHAKFTPDILYVYNRANPLNDEKLRRIEQMHTEYAIRGKEKYNAIDTCEAAQTRRAIYFTPGTSIRLFDINDPVLNSDGQRVPMYQLRKQLLEKGYEVYQANSLNSLPHMEYLFVFDILVDDLAKIEQYPFEKRILFLWEPPSVVPHNYNKELHQHFSKIFTWDDSLVDNKKYFKFYYPVCHNMLEPIDFNKKKLCTLIANNRHSNHPSELYSQRLATLNFFENTAPQEFDVYGGGWDTSLYSTYKGRIQKKIDVLRHYKFSICYENIANIPGYITEKIFDCFWAGCVPVYWGAPNIEQYIPKNCFIARQDFASYTDLYNYLKNISEKEYEEYLNNIRAFLASEQAYKFTKEYFISTILKIINKP